MDSFALIIFGITSNLARKYLIPALYDMAEKGELPEKMSIIGVARSPMKKSEFKTYVQQILNTRNIHHQHEIKKETFDDLINRLHYLNGNLDDPEFYNILKEYLNRLTTGGNKCNNRIFYLATYPQLYKDVFEGLNKTYLNEQKKGWVRLMIEKPIGNNLASAKQLNQLLKKYFSEEQIYRLDHYLGKETLQNILVFRFSNGIFEPLINSDYIDHIQITAAEDFGIGKRAGYYDAVGALKDVGQNHLLQMLAFATMDAPSEFSNEAVTHQRIKILKSLKPIPEKIVFGQYDEYIDKVNIDSKSTTDTFFALKTYLQNERFKDVPIYIRAGKKLKQTVTEISIVFKTPINRLLKSMGSTDEPNALVYRIQPNEGIVLKILTKIPGHDAKLEPQYMQFCYRGDPHMHHFPDPHEKLLMDTIKGDQTFFNDAEEVEAAWEFIDPLAKVRGKPHIYRPGTWGPKEADKLITDDGREWIEPSMDFCRI